MTIVRPRLYVLLSDCIVALLDRVATRFLPDAVEELYRCLHILRKQAVPLDRAWTIHAHALICAEDHRFHMHSGIDLYGVCRAIVRCSIYRQRQGASTIEQQLVRTITADYRPTYGRKIREVLLASTVRRRMSKDEVLAAYLQAGYFGTDLYGVESASAVVESSVGDDQVARSAYLIAHLRYPHRKKAPDIHADHRGRRAILIGTLMTRPYAWSKNVPHKQVSIADVLGVGT